MKIYEAEVIEEQICTVKIKAESASEAKKIIKEIIKDDPAYVASEMNLYGKTEWTLTRIRRSRKGQKK